MTKPDCDACREKDAEVAQLKDRLEAVIKLVSVGSPEGARDTMAGIVRGREIWEASRA